MKKTNSKYALSELLVGKYKIFPISVYDKIRMAAHFTAKRYGWKLVTKKSEKTVKVTRVL